MDNKSVKVTMSLETLEDIVFKASSKACSNLYNGLVKAYLDRYDKDFETIIKELDDINLKLQHRGNENEHG
ncbi:hypothetical protein ACSU64_05650 [Bacillaceae bacterium C204]|uniref:hypothetical protein n=1 Tax=Neobacillus sp. 204 TaxID=3383351 RepID=UPI003979EE8B